MATRLEVIARTPIEVTPIEESTRGRVSTRHAWKFTVTLADNTTRTFEGSTATMRAAVAVALRASGRLIEKGIE